ncbi:MAG: beta-lactamase family protein [Clostridia bacterium]|nr:beta-lactamase family protein [Clostridia bacterium]
MKKLDFDLLKSNINNAADYDFANNKIFGSAYYVYRNGKSFTECFGTMSEELSAPITDKTVFRLASMTKPITATGVMILVDKGLLSLSDPVSKYIKAFDKLHVMTLESGKLCDKGESPVKVTVRDLLTHTSGFGCDQQKINMMTTADKATTDSLIDYHIRTGLDFVPGTAQQYSPLAAFNVAAKIIEIVSQKDYYTFLKEEIFDPCGMVDTCFIPNGEQWNRLVPMHNRQDGKSVVAVMRENCVFGDYPVTHFLGGAGLISTLSDYKEFAHMLLNKGCTHGKRILSDKAFDTLTSPQVSSDIMPGDTRWALGMRVIVDESYKYLAPGTFGWSGAYGTHFFVDPKNSVCAVYMKNSLFDGGAGNESARLFEKAISDSLC